MHKCVLRIPFQHVIECIFPFWEANVSTLCRPVHAFHRVKSNYIHYKVWSEIHHLPIATQAVRNNSVLQHCGLQSIGLFD